jgi:phytoene dehydrogenase-like protein
MDGAKKVVVIGTGIGGAGVAALLAAKGHEVTLLEKNAFIGGKCSSFEKDGYIVDTGVHMYSMGGLGPHGDIARMCGGHQEWLYKNPQADIYANGDVLWRNYQGLSGFIGPRGIHSIGSFAAGCIHKERKALKTGTGVRKLLEREAYRTAKEHGLMETLRMLIRALRLDGTALEELNDVTVQDFFHRVSDSNILLQQVGTYCMVLMVIPPHQASVGELLYCMGRMLEKNGLGVPKGGSREVPGSFIGGLEKSGGSLKLNREVTRVIVEDGRAVGVECANGEIFHADIVISNAGIKRTVEMAGEISFPAEYVDYVKGLKYSYSYITKKYGLSHRALDVKSPCIFNTPYVNADHMFDYIDEGGVPEDPLLFLPIPSEWDEHTAPPGKQLVIMGVPGPIEVNPRTIAQSEAILAVGEKRLFEKYPKMAAAIEWELTQHIATTAAITGKPTGECIGLAQCVGQTGVNKPSPRTPVEGLWLVGTDAGGRGVGTENAATSALYVAALTGERDLPLASRRTARDTSDMMFVRI